MSGANRENAKELFIKALEKEPAERKAFLEETCGEDEALKKRVQELLKAHEVASGFLAEPYGKAEKASSRTDPANAMEGRQIGEFRIKRWIASGGMGTVYEAEQIPLNRTVALKVLPSHLSYSETAILKFRREAEAGGRQHHPGIVAIYAVGEHEGIHYIAQELVEGGRNLHDRLMEIRDRELQPPDYFRESAEIVAHVADALEHAHESGVIHRDIKPSNILLTGEGTPKVTDFGLAKVEDALALSRTGELAGTPYYMSPEQAMSRPSGIDKRTDIYSLGATLYEMLTLKYPFEGKTSQEVLRQILHVDPKDPHGINARVPRDLSLICLKAMEKSPGRRYQSMREFSEDLRRFLNGEVIHAKPAGLSTKVMKRVKRNPVISAAAGVALLAFVGFLAYVLFVSYPNIRQERDLANAEKNRAVAAEAKAERERTKAEEQARIAEERYNQVIRLSDVKELDNLEAEAKKLWPAYPENVERLELWLTRANKLLGRLDDHRLNLEALQARALPYDEEAKQKDREAYPYWKVFVQLEKTREKLAKRIASIEGERESRDPPENLEALKKELSKVDQQIELMGQEIDRYKTWSFASMEERWQHDALFGLVSGLERWLKPDGGTLKSMQGRYDFASTIYEKTCTEYQEEWDQTIASIADPNECPKYRGLAIEPRVGLVPIGRDFASGLWEFAHLQSGEIPERDKEGRLMLTEETGLVFILIPGDSFEMGARPPSDEYPLGSPNVDPDVDPDIWLNEGPVHEVTLQPFFLSKYEMTQGQWLRFKGKNPSFYAPGEKFGDKTVSLLNPVEQVSWLDCGNLLFHMKLRFPSESEWEYAARAGTTTIWWTGNDKLSLQGAANVADLYCMNNDGPSTWSYEEELDDGYTIHAPVGSFLPNPFGLHDMHGNLMEWCQDISGRYEVTPIDGSAYQTSGSPRKIMRGGDWAHTTRSCRSANRGNQDWQYKINWLGLRPAASLE